MRLACLFVPLFPLAARLRSEPDLKGEAVAVFEGNGNCARVIAATRKARHSGIEMGMTLPQARAILPGLVARGRDREGERAAQEALLEVADSFSPRVEDAGEGVAYLDLEGHPALRASGDRVIGRSGDRDPKLGSSNHKSQITNHKLVLQAELSLGRDLIAVAEKASLPARVGIAASKLAARLAAGLPQSPTVVAPGQEASFLAPLPLSRLAPELEIAETLERWGLRAIGDLAKLPEGEVASRLGEAGRALHATARGLDPRPLMPRLAALGFSEGMDLEWPLISLEAFLFLGNAALERLMQRLESQALACTRLEVTLKLDPAGCDARAIALPAPTRDVKTLLTLVRLELEARPLGSPIVGFAFVAHPDRPRRAQLALFGPPALSPDRLATTIARLASLLGADRVGSPRTLDGHRPERFALASYEPLPPPAFPLPAKTGRGLLAVRVLRPPVELEVITSSHSEPGHPERNSCHPERSSCSPERSCHPERSTRHPERSACHPERSEGSTPSITNHQSQITNFSLPPSPRLPVPPSSSVPASPRPRVPASLPPPVIASGRPISLKSVAPDGGPQIAGTVKIASGPWSMEEGWWLADSGSGRRAASPGPSLARGARSLREGPAPVAARDQASGEAVSPSRSPVAQPDLEQAGATGATDRDYWDVELSDGALYRIYRDRKSGSWYADGMYD